MFKLFSYNYLCLIFFLIIKVKGMFGEREREREREWSKVG